MLEKWRMINGYHNYAVSSRGRVRNLDTGKLLKHQKSGSRGGYAFINLYRDKKRKNFNVHILVALAFIGPRPVNHVIHHKNHNRTDPRLANLEYVTQRQNCLMRKGKA